MTSSCLIFYTGVTDLQPFEFRNFPADISVELISSMTNNCVKTNSGDDVSYQTGKSKIRHD